MDDSIQLKKSEICRQVEYYFGDYNYPRDKYLRNLGGRDGQTLISTIASFKKMQSLTTDLNFIISSLRTSSFLVVSDDGLYVRRRTPLPRKTHDSGRLTTKPHTKISSLDVDLEDKTSLRVYNKIIYAENMAGLCDKLVASAVTKLDLRRNLIGAGGARHLATLLGSPSCRLDDIFLFKNEIGDDGAAALSQSLHSNTSLTKLNLCENQIGVAGAKALAEMLARNGALQALDLNNNPMVGDNGALLIVESLSKNASLKILSLWNTGLTDRAGLAFINFLKGRTNRALEKVNLKQNGLSPLTENEINSLLL